MAENELLFAGRDLFRAWLQEHEQGEGVWLVFSKTSSCKTLSAAEALEEALCFGWIDGVMEKIDEEWYKKYFAPRRATSRWSEKNRKLAMELEERGKMSPAGRRAIEEARRRGLFEGEKRAGVSEEQVEELRGLLAPYAKALANFDAMTPSVRRTYTGAYFFTKTEAGRAKKLAQLVERLEWNLNPMESPAKKKAETP